ncbi:MAG TPA: amino acid adenylation domain-containing protein, partial [Gaiellaceae bacterium]
MRPSAGTGPAPLSPLQEGLWLADRLLPDGPGFTIGSVQRLRGRLDTDALAWSVEQIGARHEILRTAIVASDGFPQQLFRPEVRLELEHVPVVGSGDPERLAHDLVLRDPRFAVDVEAGRPLRTILLELRPDDHVFVLLTHHVVWDAWSWGIFLGELAELYSARVNGRSPALPELSVSYRDYALWTRDRLEREVGSAQLAYWRSQLAGAPALLDLPLDRPLPPTRDGAGEFFRRRLPREVVAQAQQLSRSEGVTLFMTTLAAYAILLARHARQHDVVIGTPFAGDRNRPQLEHLIGLFVNMLPLRVDTSAPRTFRELLAHVQGVASGAFANYEVPFERLVRELRPPRSLAHTPLFRVSFNLNHPAPPFALEGVEVEALPWGQPLAQYDLMLDVELQGADAGTAWAYNRNVFDEATVGELARQFQTLLADAVARPDAPLRELRALDAVERERVLALRGDVPDTREPVCVHERVALWARTTPDAVAVVDGAEELTYRELDERAERLAVRLRRAGVRTDTAVGVLVERSAELVVSFLAVLKAGGAYVPLDPGYPPARLEQMLASVDARVLVAGRELLGRLERPPVEVLLVDEPDDAAAGELPPLPAHPDQLAYVVYTSGSTGEPKPVGATHRGVVGLVVDANFVRVGPGDRIALVSAPTFDATTFELWAPLLNGATLCVLPRDDVLSPQRLAAALDERSVTVLHVPAALVNDDEHRRRLGALPVRSLLFGGEVVKPHAVRSLLENGVRGNAVDCYGPTEATMLASFAPLAPADAERARVPVGRAVSGSEVYVLDERLAALPVAMPGELCIGGDRLARGYLERAGLTAERFVPNPYGRPGSRLYRTGDVARFLPDGRLDLLGRFDRQVKIRGFRIEPGEVEAALASLPGVAAAAVAVRERAPGDRQLVGYVAGASLDGRDLRRALRATLPEYMLPTEVVVLDRLPVTGNGKVDYAALPAARGAPAPTRAEPRTPTEELVAAVWREVLDRDDAAVEDDFFDAGGHSLLAVALLARLSAAAGIEVPVEALFGDATIAGLATWIEGALSQRASPADAVVSLRAGAGGTLVLAHPIGGGLFAYRELVAALRAGVRVVG